MEATGWGEMGLRYLSNYFRRDQFQAGWGGLKDGQRGIVGMLKWGSVKERDKMVEVYLCNIMDFYPLFLVEWNIVL